MPTSIVQRQPIGWRPGTARRPSAPMTSPDTIEPDEVAHNAD